MVRQYATLSTCLLLFATTVHCHSTDLIIFSYNRPLQLHALLESIELHMIGLNEISVVGRADDDNYRAAYDQVAHDFPTVIFKWQGENPKADFKPLTLECLHATDCPYVMFAVDDNIVKDAVDCDDCIYWLEKTDAYGFHLRLGLHITHCYVRRNCPEKLPPLLQISENVLLWHFNEGRSDWRMPHSVDMAVYRKEDVSPFLKAGLYTSPNTLEIEWYRHATNSRNIGLFYAISKIINIPLNKVQQEFPKNQSMQGYSPDDLLIIFLSGKRIDPTSLYRLINSSSHLEWEPQYVSAPTNEPPTV